MLSAIALLVGVVLFAVATAIGAGLFFSIRQHYVKRLPHVKIWIIAGAGAIPSLLTWILLIRSKVHFIEGAGPDNWGPFFNAVIFGSMLPGVTLFGAGMALLLTRPFLRRNQEDLDR